MIMTTFYGDGRVIGYMEDITFVQNTLSPAAHFVGDYDPNRFYDYGAVCIRHNGIWMFNGRDWYQISECQTNTSNKIKRNITNCPNCGAPLHNNKCMYCGTER